MVHAPSRTRQTHAMMSVAPTRPTLFDAWGKLNTGQMTSNIEVYSSEVCSSCSVRFFTAAAAAGGHLFQIVMWFEGKGAIGL